MRYSAQVKPISYLKANAADILASLAEKREPMVIRQNGEARAVIQDVASFEQTQETLSPAEAAGAGRPGHRGRQDETRPVGRREAAREGDRGSMSGVRFEVELTQGAEDDLEAIHRYLAGHRSPSTAETLLDAFLERIATLEPQPERGSVPAEFEALGIREFRQILLDPYRLIYRVLDGKVFILVVADGRRDMQALLERRLLGRDPV